MTYLGKISYGLYVFHSLVLLLVWALLTRVRQNAAGRGSMIVLGFTLTVALAALSYRFVEAPMLRLKRRFTYVESRTV